MKYKEDFRQSGVDSSSENVFTLPLAGMPPLVSQDLMTEIKSILSNLRINGCAITREVVIAVANGVLST